MNAFRSVAIWLCLLTATYVSAQQQPPALHVPNASNPPFAAFIAWHESLLRSDFGAYQNATFWLPEMKEELQKQMFEQLRVTTPTIVKITEQKRNPNGSVTFYAVGCKDARRLVNVITVGNTNGAWRVASSGWGPPWNETAKLCPV